MSTPLEHGIDNERRSDLHPIDPLNVITKPPPVEPIANTLINIVMEHMAHGQVQIATYWAGQVTNPKDIAQMLRQAADLIDRKASPIALP